MSEFDVMGAYKAILEAPPFSITTFIIQPDLPYTQGDYPFICVRPMTQQVQPETAGGIKRRGYYRLVYVMEVSGDMDDVGKVIAAAVTFANLLVHTIYTDETVHSLNDTVDWIGEGNGVLVRYEDEVLMADLNDNPLYGVPIDVDTFETEFF
jgi:hypothetical protein